MKIYCDTNQLPALTVCGPHPKPHGERGLSNHYHLRFDPKLGHGICKINCISCACVACKLMLDQPWISGILLKKARQKPIIDCTYWPVLGSYNNWNIIELTPKSTQFEAFDEIHQAVLDIIRDNMTSLVQSGKYIAINTAYKTKN